MIMNFCLWNETTTNSFYFNQDGHSVEADGHSVEADGHSVEKDGHSWEEHELQKREAIQVRERDR